MPTWEETKRAGQTAFISQEKGFHESISDTYQQIRSTGHIYPVMDAESLTQQIAERDFEQPEVQQPEFDRNLEQDLEPER